MASAESCVASRFPHCRSMAKRVLRFLLVTVGIQQATSAGRKWVMIAHANIYEDSKNRAVMLGFFNQRVPEYRMCPQSAFRVCQRPIFHIERSHKSVECGVVCNGNGTHARSMGQWLSYVEFLRQ